MNSDLLYLPFLVFIYLLMALLLWPIQCHPHIYPSAHCCHPPFKNRFHCVLCVSRAFRGIFSSPKSIQATVTILENLHVILEKTPHSEIRTEIFPLLFNALDSATIQVQVCIMAYTTRSHFCMCNLHTDNKSCSICDLYSISRKQLNLFPPFGSF